MYYSAIGFLAILILFIVNWDVLHDSRIYDKPAWNVYRRFLFAVLAYYVTDVLWGILEDQKLSKALFSDTIIYFIAMAVGISFWAEYTVAYLQENNGFGRFLVITGRFIAGLTAGLAIINIFTPVLFTVDKKTVYQALPLRYVLLACQILFLITISLHSFAGMFRLGIRSRNSTRYRILGFFGLIMALCLFIQLWFPLLPLYSIAYMLGTCLLHAFVINDEKEEYRREQKEAEKLMELKDRFLSLLNNMPGMTFTKDAKTGRFLACNQAFAEYAHKASPEEVAGLTDAEIFDADTAAHFVEDDRIALSLSTPYVFYEEVPDAAGNPRQLQTTKLKYTDTAGRLCILGMCQDITDLIQIQHEQAQTKEAYESAVSTGLMFTHIAQTLARDYTEMFYVNTDTEEFTEYRKAEGGSSLSEIRRGWHFFSDCKLELSEKVYEEDRDSFLQAMNRKKLMKTLGRKDTFIMTFRMMNRNKPIYISMKISRMENDEKHIIIGFTDVDAEMREAMAKSEALSDALSSAEAANKAKSTFLSGMSHEIRTPINSIIGLNTLALRKNPDTETREYLEKIGASAQHLRSLINDILDISRIESGRVILHKNEFALGSLLEQINTLVMSQCNDKGLHYECRVQGGADDTYIGDEMKLKEVLLNILSNAIKFTDEPGNVTLTVERTAEYEDQATLLFRIQDTGIGMDREYLPRIFDAFSQENAASRSKYGSSGLGMAITKSIVELMNGTILVDSEKGVGTMFTVILTLRRGERKDTEHSGEIDPQAMKVLVVDDNPVEAEHARMVLEEVGIHTDACTSGQEALSRMEVQHSRKQPYNMVLMDWNMPGMSGSEASAEIIKLYGAECIIVAMTAYSWEDIREDANRVGVETFLMKPLFASNIIEHLERIARQCHLAIFKEKKRARLTGRRILLAEDVELNAEILMDMLEMENVKADHAENGRVAVDLFKDSTAGVYSAILMDVRMPEMDGLEATRQIRALDREDAKRIPIIALTANAFDEDVQRSIQAGMNAHLNKPVEADHLIRILGELIYESEELITGSP